MSDEVPDFDEITDWAFALLTMRVDTPGGEWLPADYERVYEQGWAELVRTFGVASAAEGAVLDLVNISMHLIDYLVAQTGRPAQEWLQRVHRDYVQTQRLDGDS